MKKEILFRPAPQEFRRIDHIMVNALGEVNILPGRRPNFIKVEYRYFDTTPLKLEFASEVMRSRFEAELRHSPYSSKCDVQREILAALYGESDGWRLVSLSWTQCFLIFYVVNQELLRQGYPTDDDLRLHCPEVVGPTKGFTEICIPTCFMHLQAEDALEFMVNVTSGVGKYRSLQTFAYALNTLIEARPNDGNNELEFFHMHYDYPRQLPSYNPEEDMEGCW